MFERNRVETAQPTAVPVELTTIDGDRIQGRMVIAAGRTIFDALNGNGSFVEFEPYRGERRYVAKTMLRDVRLLSMPKAQPLPAARDDDDVTSEPHTVLGVAKDASMSEVKAAWLRLTKAYHPDRYAGVELPGEVTRYLDATVRRINAAYKVMEKIHRSAAAAPAPATGTFYRMPRRFGT